MREQDILRYCSYCGVAFQEGHLQVAAVIGHAIAGKVKVIMHKSCADEVEDKAHEETLYTGD